MQECARLALCIHGTTISPQGFSDISCYIGLGIASNKIQSPANKLVNYLDIC